MSEEDRGEIPREDVSREFERAEQMLADATTALEVDISGATVISRLYYACFHAAQAALYVRGLDPQSHGQVKTSFGRVLVRDGDVPREYGRFLNGMETYRRRVDCGSGGVEREPEDLVDMTTELLETLSPIVDVDGPD